MMSSTASPVTQRSSFHPFFMPPLFDLMRPLPLNPEYDRAFL